MCWWRIFGCRVQHNYGAKEIMRNSPLAPLWSTSSSSSQQQQQQWSTRSCLVSFRDTARKAPIGTCCRAKINSGYLRVTTNTHCLVWRVCRACVVLRNALFRQITDRWMNGRRLSSSRCVVLFHASLVASSSETYCDSPQHRLPTEIPPTVVCLVGRT